MSNVAPDYLQLWRELVVKYGKKPLSDPGNKALALVILTRSFKMVPASITFEAELEMLAESFENMSLPKSPRN
jgi:hypothetical protein